MAKMNLLVLLLLGVIMMQSESSASSPPGRTTVRWSDAAVNFLQSMKLGDLTKTTRFGFQNVNHIEEDMQVPGNLLFALSNSLRSSRSDGQGQRSLKIAENPLKIWNFPTKFSNGKERSIKITGFVQLSKSKIVMVNSDTHCLSLLDRKSGNVSNFVGYCNDQAPGYQDGSFAEARFDSPHSIIKAHGRIAQYLVSDSKNGAVRRIKLALKSVNTFVKNAKLISISNIVQGSLGQVYATVLGQIFKIAYASRSVSLLMGQRSTHLRDGPRILTDFSDRISLMNIGSNNILFADRDNSRFGMLDTENDVELWIDFCDQTQCLNFTKPSAMLTTDKGIFVAASRGIYRIDRKNQGSSKRSSVTAVAKFIASTTTTPQMRRTRNHLHTPSTQPTPTADKNLVRTLTFRAHYSISCSAVSYPSTRFALESLAEANYNRISEICQRDCGKSMDSQAELSCSNNTLTVLWSTNKTFDSSTSDLPLQLRARLASRLLRRSTVPILHTLIATDIPKVIYPLKNKSGAYADFILVSTCTGNMYYDEMTDTCQ